jgi:thiol-disulfide isomerase/thioredoxin
MIKKISCLALLCIALATNAQKPVTITGVLKFVKMPIKPVKLFKVVDGETAELTTITPTHDGQFGFLFYPEYEGFYAIGTGNTHAPNENYKFYFKGGEKLSLSISDWDYTLTGTQNSKENVALTQWHIFTDSLHDKAINFMHGNSTYVDFFPQLESTVAKAKTWWKTKSTGNPKFDKVMPSIMKLDLALYAVTFLYTPRTAHPSMQEYSSYYSSLHTADFTKTTGLVYNYPWGVRAVGMLISLDQKRNGYQYEANRAKFIENCLSYVQNDTLKGDVILANLGQMKSYEEYKKIMDVFGSYMITENQKKRDVAIVSPLATLKKGDAAYNFSYPDVTGKQVSMKDLKGKVVVVDVWATWCGPCKREIPYLKQLEEEMKGKNVEFVSISVDENRDKNKWLTMVDTAKLGGTQLFAGSPNDISKYYRISGIPRFMIFDQEGKIISIDSPRPSEPELKELLLKTLGESGDDEKKEKGTK